MKGRKWKSEQLITATSQGFSGLSEQMQTPPKKISAEFRAKVKARIRSRGGQRGGLDVLFDRLADADKAVGLSGPLKTQLIY